MNAPNRWWTGEQWLAAVVATVASGALYAWSAAPNVTLLDAGEFIVAAQHFGVPHPTGYPLWTLLAWLFQLLPLGNPAWEVALFSGLVGALAVGLAAGLVSSMMRWLFPQFGKVTVLLSAWGWAGLFAVCEPMWSQASIAEVYTLHALLTGFFLLMLYGWIRNPAQEGWMYATFFALALGFSNHHLVLVLAPLPFLVAVLLRRDLLADLLVAASLTGILFYLWFALLSAQTANIVTATRLTWLVLGVALGFVWMRKGRLRWNFIAWLPVVVAAGLLPYLYMPLASSTNPPMNWGYARTADGFFYSINRSQYGGSLDEQILRTAGRLVGTAGLRPAVVETEKVWEPWEVSRTERAQAWIGFFWWQLLGNFTVWGLLCLLLALLLIREAELRQRTWLYLLLLTFFLSAFLQPVLDGAETDRDGWWVQMPYHTYSMLAFALVCSVGFGVLLRLAEKRWAAASWVLPGVLVLCVAWPLGRNFESSNQRERWFGWEFGHRMLADLPEGAVVFGGTDPGRFVPTHMIFGESVAPAQTKRDPDFDRRDLYILTQNALADEFYLKYLRDHYGEGRPPARNWFERWLGRGEMYPEKTLRLPTEEEVQAIVREEAEKTPERLDAVRMHSAVARWVFEQNKAEHAFFLEESFPMEWSLDHAVPEGLIFRLAPEPVTELAPEVVAADLQYWQELLEQLLENPRYPGDFDARRSFSKLRVTGGRVYEHRGLKAAAELAYRQAAALHPGNLEPLIPLSRLLWDRGEFEEPVQLWDLALEEDPLNRRILFLRVMAGQRREWAERSEELRAVVAEDPRNAAAWWELIQGYARVMEDDRMDLLLAEALVALGDDPQFLLRLRNRFLAQEDRERAQMVAEALVEAAPGVVEHRLTWATLLWLAGEEERFYEQIEVALAGDAERTQEILRSDPAFAPLREQERWQQLVEGERLP
jgi:tetratricopeptide (TPR) repeat protein